MLKILVRKQIKKIGVVDDQTENQKIGGKNQLKNLESIKQLEKSLHKILVGILVEKIGVVE